MKRGESRCVEVRDGALICVATSLNPNLEAHRSMHLAFEHTGRAQNIGEP